MCLPRDAYYATGELVPLLDDNDQLNPALAGRICCDQIVPYPPGIPVLVPGQRITPNIVDFLVRYLRVQNKVELHGVVYQGYVPSIRVLNAEEQARLGPMAVVASNEPPAADAIAVVAPVGTPAPRLRGIRRNAA